MNNKLDRIEAQLQNLFEKKLVQIITGRRPSKSLIERLMAAIQSNLKQGQDDQMVAPDRFVINVNPEELVDWQAHQNVLDQIAVHLQEKGRQEGIYFQSDPIITIMSDVEIPRQQYLINVHFSQINPKTALPDTTAMPPAEPGDLENKIPEEAYLIVRGSKTFPLNKMVVNIGRHSENDLVLDDPHISRHHAQLRVINHYFVLFDVGSVGGVFLNGKKTSQATLQSGDVIRLGTINLIFIQETLSEDPTIAFPIDNESGQ